ncbi:unnamed protein product [Sphacelaria rigidula]
MNASIFPVRYHDSFYADVPDGNPDFNQFAYVDGSVVGSMCCRIEPTDPPSAHDRLYIMTLGVLAPWRRRGVGKQLLLRILSNLARYPSVGEVYLHVQTSNHEAVKFYEAHGFNVEETIENYYMRIEPPDCYVLRRRICEQKDEDPR